MKFFKFLSTAFPIYVGIAMLSPYILESGIGLPNLLEQFLEILGMTLIVITLPFEPLLKIFGMWTTAYWSFPTTTGIILSSIVWEIILVVVFLIIRSRKIKVQQF